MKLTTVSHVSIDGVMQGLGGSDEDRRDGFERGGWALPLFSDEGAEFVEQVFQRAHAFLFGRWTYEIFASSWGAIAEMRAQPIGVALNEKRKYVVSTTLADAHWGDTTVLSDNIAGAIGELKSELGGELQVHGSGVLVRWLLEQDLVDEVTLLTYPVVIGQGTRLFPDVGPDRAFDLVDSRAFPHGITLHVYRPIGRPEYAQ